VTTSEYPLLYVFAFLFLFFLLKPLLVHSHQQSKVASHGIRIESDLRFFFSYLVRLDMEMAAKNVTQSYAFEGHGYNLALGAEVRVPDALLGFLGR
jgi:hypothetical protein